MAFKYYMGRLVKRKEKVVQILRKNPNGLTIAEIAKKARYSRHTVSNILAELKGGRKITIRKVGMAQIHYWGKKKIKNNEIKYI